MRTRRLLVVTLTGLLGLVSTGPAVAAPGDSTATVTIIGGSLQITVPATAGSLGTSASSAGGSTISGSLGQVHVDDARGALAGSGWVASAVSTDFTSPSGSVIPASSVGYTAGPIARVGIVVDLANDPADLSDAAAVVTATAITGNNTATWNPTITVTVPGGTAAGVYSATITHSVA